MEKALENDPLPLGVFYQVEHLTFEENLRENEKNTLYRLTHDVKKIQELFESY